MDKLSVILVNDNIIRSTLADLPRRTGAEYWLVGSPHYVERLSDAHRAVFASVLTQDDFEPAAVAERLAPHLAGRDPAGLEFLTNDESCELTCVALQERFGRARWTAGQVLPFVNKMATKAALAPAGIRVPRHIHFDRQRLAADGRAYCEQIAAEIGFPMVVKPVDKYASMDVRRLDSLPQLRAWASWAASPRDRNTYEVDEFIGGTIYNCDSLVRDGRVIWSGVCRNINPCMEFAEGRTIGVYTLPADDPVGQMVRAFSDRVLAVLDPPDGGVHMEIFLTPAGELVFLEVAARPPGGDMRAVYLRCLGFDIDVAHFLLRAGEPFEPPADGAERYGGWFIHPRHKGTVAEIDLPELVSEQDLRLMVTVGDVIDADSRHIVEPPSAELMLFNADFGGLERDVDKLRDMTLYRVEA